MTKQTSTSKVPREILDLVDKFTEHADTYRRGNYNEDQLRRDFLDPFFTALGWDVTNEQGYAEAYRDVISEDSLRVEKSVRAPDYGFRIGGVRKFFVEAKKPSVDIKTDTSPAFQLRRYAWTAKLPLSILTDFEELAVYDCRIKPDKNDKASTARVKYFKYTEYADRWDEIADIFAREAILKGSFDKYAESTKKKRGTATVDDAFLEEIEQWREALAKNISLRNREITDRELNFSVQRIIDRIIFLRMCEGRGIEPYARIGDLRNGKQIYRRLVELFYDADAKYNSGLFHFEREKDREPPDELTTSLEIDDKVLKDIVGRLYYPESPYEFAALPADILGQVYEQFLGKVIRLTKGHQAKVEDKPEVKKAGGVYYTPTYIVDYIVENTVGKLLEGKTPQQIGGLTKTFQPSKRGRPLTVLDPACGSGSFLIVAYQYLLDWYLKQYTEVDKPAKHARGASPRVYQAGDGDWRLTAVERKRILLSHIYGVDIDFQAVEVTKLSLLLKVLEGETEETLNRQLKLFQKQRALPDLANNIKCGNSLIGSDFYENQQLELFDEDERLRINVFDWQTEFAHVFTGKNPGFDAVVGNPPYVRVRVLRDFVPEAVIEYLKTSYECAVHVWDVYLLFYEKALSLTRTKGRFAFIVPIQTLHQPNCESLRRLLLNKTAIHKVVDLSSIRVFQGPLVKNCILICEHDKPAKSIQTVFALAQQDLLQESVKSWPRNKAIKNPNFSLKVALLSPKHDLCQKLQAKSWQLGELCYVTFGLRSCAKGKGQGGKDRLITTNRNQKYTELYLEGREITRYGINSSGNFIRYLPEEMYSPRTPGLFRANKIVSQTMLSKMKLIASLDTDGHFVEQSLLCIVPHGIVTNEVPAARLPLEYLLGILNSRLQSFYFATYVIDHSLGGGLIHATPGSQSQLLIPRASDEDVATLVGLVEGILFQNEKGKNAKTPHEQTALQRQIAATDRQIDQLVYELYGLTDKEIAIVEEATK